MAENGKLLEEVKFSFGGKSAIVTGGASGIGRAVTEALLASGANVAVLDRNETALSGLQGERLLPLFCDLTDVAAVERALERTADAHGSPHFLVNSVGLNIRKAALELEESELRRMFETNFFAVFRLCRLVAERMSDSRDAGEAAFRKIVNIASTGAWQGSRNYSGYNSTKAALVTATKVLANEWAERGIIVNALCPGPTMTPFVEPYYSEHPELVNAIIGRTPAGRIAGPEDHAGIVLFLLSNLSDWIVGQALTSDGGKSLNG